ncbi:DUF5677 domain-containing protein [Bdellovibrio sp. HCB185ZH]|uniref:DUF5677 domain-containing protein n=1 Tax=Bdellovibrio sp. HCB185ZH TaxID=3394235 RepID=UPI0039A414DF
MVSSEELQFSSWQEYWKTVGPALEKFIVGQHNEPASQYLLSSYAYYSFSLEGLPKKIQKHNELVENAYPLLMQLQDILRGNLIAQDQLLLTNAGLNLRVAFEIRVNLRFIYQHDTPAVILQRLSDFFDYEVLMGRKNSPYLEPPSEEEEKVFCRKFPFWAKGDRLISNAVWNGDGKTAKDICDLVGMSNEYQSIFKMTSKLVHGSPLIKNLYRNCAGLNSIGNLETVTMFAALSTHHAMESLHEFFDFFGVEYDPLPYALIQRHMLQIEELK